MVSKEISRELKLGLKAAASNETMKETMKLRLMLNGLITTESEKEKEKGNEWKWKNKEGIVKMIEEWIGKDLQTIVQKKENKIREGRPTVKNRRKWTTQVRFQIQR